MRQKKKPRRKPSAGPNYSAGTRIISNRCGCQYTARHHFPTTRTTAHRKPLIAGRNKHLALLSISLDSFGDHPAGRYHDNRTSFINLESLDIQAGALRRFERLRDVSLFK